MHVTCTVGGVISGYCATGSMKAATPPISTMTIDTTQAKIGRSMKKRESIGSLSLGGIDQQTGGSRPRRLSPARHHRNCHGAAIRAQIVKTPGAQATRACQQNDQLCPDCRYWLPQALLRRQAFQLVLWWC